MGLCAFYENNVVTVYVEVIDDMVRSAQTQNAYRKLIVPYIDLPLGRKIKQGGGCHWRVRKTTRTYSNVPCHGPSCLVHGTRSAGCEAECRFRLPCRHRRIAAIVIESATGFSAKPSSLDVFHEQWARPVFSVG